MATQLQIVNRALARLGIKKQLTSLSGSTAEAEQASLFWAPVVENLLSDFHYPFALRRAELVSFPTTATAVTHSGTGTSVLTVVAASGTTGTLDVVVKVSVVIPVGVMLSVSLDGGQTYGSATVLPNFPAVTSLSSLGATLPSGAVVTINGSADTAGAYVANDTYSFTVSDGTHADWACAYRLPANFLKAKSLLTGSRAIRADERASFATGLSANVQTLWTDVDDAVLQYTAKLSSADDAALFPPLFADAVAWTLAAELALPLKVDARLAAGVAVQAFKAVDRAQVSAKGGEQEDPIPDGELVNCRG